MVAFDVVLASSTSLAYKCELEVVVIEFQHHSRVFHLPRIQVQAGLIVESASCFNGTSREHLSDHAFVTVFKS